MLSGLDGQIVLLGVFDGDIAGQGQVAHRRDAVHVGSHRGDGDLEADLIIALAGAAMSDSSGAELASSLHQMLGDDRTRQGRDQRIGVLVQGVGLERGHAEVFGEFFTRIGHICLNRAAVQRTSANNVKILSTLADIDGDCNDLSARLLADPADGHGGIEPS